jgi:hypothetical protein
MTTERYIEITNEGQRRINLWLQHKTFEEFTIGYSKMRFSMALGLLGYSFEFENWMKKEDFKQFITEDEFDDEDYDWIIENLFVNNYLLYDKEL